MSNSKHYIVPDVWYDIVTDKIGELKECYRDPNVIALRMYYNDIQHPGAKDCRPITINIRAVPDNLKEKFNDVFMNLMAENGSIPIGYLDSYEEAKDI